MQNVPMLPLDEPSPFDRFYGLALREATPQCVQATVVVRPELLQPTGVVHGGVFAAVAEGVASLGTNLAVSDAGLVAFGLNNATSFLRPVAGPEIRVQALPRHQDHSCAVWDVEMSDSEGRLCATSRVTLAIRPQQAQ